MRGENGEPVIGTLVNLLIWNGQILEEFISKQTRFDGSITYNLKK
jgi:hypothetical protein